VIEPSIGVDRLFLALLTSAYCEDEIGGEKRTFLKFHPSIAPIKVSVCSMMSLRVCLFYLDVSGCVFICFYVVRVCFICVVCVLYPEATLSLSLSLPLYNLCINVNRWLYFLS
jgi:hypothetical protein